VAAAGLAVVPYSGQSRGWFTKVAEGGEDAQRDDLKGMYANETNRKRLKAVQAVAARHGVSLNEVVLAYLLRQPMQTIPIIGATRPEQLEDSVKATALKLTPDELRELAVG
jgi:aryl-alcohol dehydrogenase-like predicted oxidoreductase